MDVINDKNSVSNLFIRERLEKKFGKPRFSKIV
jgi:hypothetical protein